MRFAQDNDVVRTLAPDRSDQPFGEAVERPDTGSDWAHRFDDMVARQMTGAPADILTAVEHPDYHMAVPTPDHFIPLLPRERPGMPDQRRQTLLKHMKGLDPDYITFLTRRG